ncbi:baseplate J/gp47 family protein [Atlantibacter hermannii]|uniref:baseplate J/gp47 family protein n=1 Tax=Atlantibacter hermannii TaxID=565 RepID=UPI0013EF015C|nr:baseplate J/gp47 family protein [Atlantibacter hermannii]
MALNLETLGLSATVTAEGISAPDYQTILDTLKGYFQQIYGTDAYLEPDSKDGQMLAIYALGIHDANNTSIAVYNSFSPSTGMGRALSSNVKINGITRKIATTSKVDVVIEGDIGTQITGGAVRDDNGIIWTLPDTVIIPPEQTITVTAACSVAGPVVALPGAITRIATPTRGWRTVTNPASATPGESGETDAQLRQRQSKSVALSALTPFVALDGAIASIDGVTRHKLYENDTGATDSNGIPPHSISAIVAGGDIQTIANVLRGKKSQGTATYGALSVTAYDLYDNPHVVHFSRPVITPIRVAITLRAFQGYTSQIGEQIKSAVAKYISSLGIGDDVLISRLYSPANLGVVSGGNARYYDITDLQIAVAGGSVSHSNIIVAYDHAAACDASDIDITVTS